MIRRGRGRLEVVLSRAVVRVQGWRGSESVWAAEQPFGSPDDLEAIFGTLLAGIPETIGTKDIEVVVEAPFLQQRELQGLPPVRTFDLRALVQQQSSQFFRQNGAPLVADACWLRGGRGQPRTALAVAADELLMERVMEAAASAGFSVTTVRPGSVLGDTRLTLLPRTQQSRNAARAADSLRRAGLGVAGLWIVVGLFLAGRLIGERRSIDAELARLAQPLAAVREARLQIHGAEALLQEVAGARAAATVLPRQLIAIVRTLPDSVVITSITLDATGSGAVTGLAQRPLAVAAALEGDPQFVHPRLEGSSARPAGNGGEWVRFTLMFGTQAPP